MSERMRRVNEVLHQVLAEGIEQLGDPDIGFATVTAVRTTPDLRMAQVYVSVLGGERRRERSVRALERAHGVLQSRVAREVRMKRTPQLTFIYDETSDRAFRVQELLEQVDPAPVPDDTTQ
jgi:ribosome-binding factor A